MDCTLCGSIIPVDESFVVVADERWRITTVTREHEVDPQTTECYHLRCFGSLKPALIELER